MAITIDTFVKKVVTVHPDTPLSAVARRMEEHNVGAVVISANRKPIGLVTDRDLALQLGARGVSAEPASSWAVWPSKSSAKLLVRCCL